MDKDLHIIELDKYKLELIPNWKCLSPAPDEIHDDEFTKLQLAGNFNRRGVFMAPNPEKFQDSYTLYLMSPDKTGRWGFLTLKDDTYRFDLYIFGKMMGYTCNISTDVSLIEAAETILSRHIEGWEGDKK